MIDMEDALCSVAGIVCVWILNRWFPLWRKTEVDLRKDLDDAREYTCKNISKFADFEEQIEQNANAGLLTDMEVQLDMAYKHLNLSLFPSMSKQWIAAIRVARKSKGREKPKDVLQDIFEDVNRLIECYQMLNCWKVNLPQGVPYEMPTYKCLNDLKIALGTYYPLSRRRDWLECTVALFNSLHNDFK